MERIYIYGVYHFFAFEVCQQFLNEGYQVIGIPYPFQDDDPELSLMIGRNANYIEWKGSGDLFTEARNETNSQTFFFLSHYDHQFLQKKHYDQIMEHVHSIISHKKIDQTIIFQPVEYTAMSISITDFTTFQEKCDAIVPNPTYLALPPLYGSRQPEKDLFVHLYRIKEAVAKVPKSKFDDVLSCETAAAFIVKNLFPHFEDTFLKSNGGFKPFIKRILEKDCEWSGNLEAWSYKDLNTLKVIEVPGTETMERNQKQWFRSMKGSQHKNSFRV